MDWEEALIALLTTEGASATGEPQEPTASVIALIGRRPGSSEDEILLTKRTDLVETHKGQVSFPGGFRDPGDRDLLTTALRECEEEIGLARGAVRILGSLPPVLTRGKVKILPWVGVVEMGPLVPNAAEVERVLYLPVPRLLQAGLTRVRIEIEGYAIETDGIECDGLIVWGATARMLENLRERLLKIRYGTPSR